MQHLMGDDEKGIKKDAETASQLKFRKGASQEHYSHIWRFWRLGNLEVEYLGCLVTSPNIFRALSTFIFGRAGSAKEMPTFTHSFVSEATLF